MMVRLRVTIVIGCCVVVRIGDDGDVEDEEISVLMIIGS